MLAQALIFQSEEAANSIEVNELIAEENKDEVLDDSSTNLEKEQKQENEEVSDPEIIKDSVSSQGDSVIIDDEKVESPSRDPKSITKMNSSEGNQGSRERSDRKTSKSQSKQSFNNLKKPTNSNVELSRITSKNTSLTNAKIKKDPGRPSSESCDGVDDKPVPEVKDIDVLDGTSNGTQCVVSDDETFDPEENGEHEDEAALKLKIEEMEMRIEKLEEELREVAALEVSLYSVVPEHGSSAHKVHTPARRLCRLYIHACKHWSDKQATIAKNTVSGLILIAKSCGNDVSRLTFWLSNTIVLRKIISQAFGSTLQSSPLIRFTESDEVGKKSDGKSKGLKWKGIPGSKHGNCLMQLVEDWQETGTFTSGLEKVESWMFSRIVESVWWQALTPHMQSPLGDSSKINFTGKLLGPSLGDQQQGIFSISLWRNAFQDAYQRLCPVRAGGHECGCLPVLARMVMEQCIARLDVAMFNAILRESAHEIPTDPVSDPIVDSKVLPIPAGDLSFGSGAQLKNSVGNWSRWLTDMFGMDADDSEEDNQCSSEEETEQSVDGEQKTFILLNALSDLLMLPKDMLIDQQVRVEVCPSISVPLIKRILCNFTPDEFCPDPVPGAVLEALNAESIVERRFSGDSVRSFPYTASPIIYSPPSSANVGEKVAEAGGKSHLARNVSAVQRKGYTSDEELEELDSPLTSVICNLPSSPTVTANGNGNHKEHTGQTSANARYELLREVWST
ncbi:Nucleolar gar2-like protein [Quillaja saponaria]|uniref:Nucleolar gar2-like protein n=1 Tax=Quillaja saponaria TaxID=32244 RepID=A0AAD7Q8I1_QUISA|nr:Nucleolar gar2-like protein [Quillaja saponaria]